MRVMINALSAPWVRSPWYEEYVRRCRWRRAPRYVRYDRQPSCGGCSCIETVVDCEYRPTLSRKICLLVVAMSVESCTFFTTPRSIILFDDFFEAIWCRTTRVQYWVLDRDNCGSREKVIRFAAQTMESILDHTYCLKLVIESPELTSATGSCASGGLGGEGTRCASVIVPCA